MNGAEYIMKFLERKNVDVIFGYPGGKVLTLYDELYKAIENGMKLQHILTRHEQGAIHAAEGYAKATKKTGVVFSTSGPGATNLVTGLADAMLDSVPIFAITGQVVAQSIGHDAFQEADMLGVTLSVTKHNYLVREIRNLPYILEEAWNIAKNGRNGPVLIDIAQNVFAEEIILDGGKGEEEIEYVPRQRKNSHTFESNKLRVIDLLSGSFRPVILAGGGVDFSDGAPENMRKFMEKYNIPCAVTLMGKSVIDILHPLALGMAGMHGLPAANTALAKSDLVIAVGVRFSDRTIGNPEAFSRTRSIIHADIDVAEISKNLKVTLPVVIDANEFFLNLLKLGEDMDVASILKEKKKYWGEWVSEVTAVKEKTDDSVKMLFTGELKMREVIRYVVKKEIGDDISYVTDVGQHQMIAAQETHNSKEGTFLSSGGLGTMGFGLPAAIGCAFGKAKGKVILFSGDGGIQMNIQELATVRKVPVPVKIFILDNNRLGMVRQWQSHFYGGRYSQSVLDDNPDFRMIANAYGIESVKIDSRKTFFEKIDEILENDKTMLIHLITDPDENVYPIIPGGKSNHEMILSEERE